MLTLDEFKELIKEYSISIELNHDDYKIKKKKISNKEKTTLSDDTIYVKMNANEYNSLIKINGYNDFMSTGNLDHLRVEVFSCLEKKHLYRVAYEEKNRSYFRKTTYKWFFTGRNTDNPDSIIIREEIVLPSKIIENQETEFLRLKLFLEFIGFLEVNVFKEKIKKLNLQPKLFETNTELVIGGGTYND